MDPGIGSRRSFLRSAYGVLTAAGLFSANWSAVTAAARHALDAATALPPAPFEFLSIEDAADVAAVASQIVPSGATPGAREAHAVYFVDRALATFFSDSATAFRSGLAGFQTAFRIAHPTIAAFDKADCAQQIDFLKTVDQTDFFASVRVLTVLGMFSSPQYAGNHAGAGWELLGFEDRHVFEPPFGYYDAHYPGFIPHDTKTQS